MWPTDTLKMDNLKTALSMIRKDCYMSSIDLSNAC